MSSSQMPKGVEHKGGVEELGGWETASMVRRYARLSAEHLARFAEKISRPRVVSGTNLAQGPDY